MLETIPIRGFIGFGSVPEFQIRVISSLKACRISGRRAIVKRLFGRSSVSRRSDGRAPQARDDLPVAEAACSPSMKPTSANDRAVSAPESKKNVWLRQHPSVILRLSSETMAPPSAAQIVALITWCERSTELERFSAHAPRSSPRRGAMPAKKSTARQAAREEGGGQPG
jgi:hypothetical protein